MLLNYRFANTTDFFDGFNQTVEGGFEEWGGEVRVLFDKPIEWIFFHWVSCFEIGDQTFSQFNDGRISNTTTTLRVRYLLQPFNVRIVVGLADWGVASEGF